MKCHAEVGYILTVIPPFSGVFGVFQEFSIEAGERRYARRPRRLLFRLLFRVNVIVIVNVIASKMNLAFLDLIFV